MSATAHRLLIAGGGIAGLAAAIAASDAGCDVLVLEAAEEMRPLGAGLSLWPNGVRALRSLGAADWIGDGGASFGDAGIRRARDGGLIASTSPELLRERYGEPLVLVHRADLLEALFDRVGSGRVRLGAAVRRASPDGTVELASGETLRADAVIGADGIDSAVRAGTFGSAPAAASGIVAYRAVAEWEAPVPAGEYWGRGQVFGLVPLTDGRLYWYAAFREGEDSDVGPEAQLQALRDRFAGWAQPIPGVLASTGAEILLRHPLRDRALGSRWGEGRVTLCGDAAHPMLPFLGQGACCALEDAVVLGAALGAGDDLVAALRSYERDRAPRAKLLVKRSRAAARVALLAQPLLAGLRDQALGAIPDSVRMRQLDQAVGRPQPDQV